MTDFPTSLAELGWGPFFQAQLPAPDSDEAGLAPARVMAVHRGQLDIAGPVVSGRVTTLAESGDDLDRPAVGDWLLMDPTARRPVRLLARRSLFRRGAPGAERRVQLIAANVDTVFVVTSCNRDFNLARLERYLTLAGEAGVRPVVVLTKVDLAEEEAAGLAAEVARLAPDLPVERVDARDRASVAGLEAWCGPGQTVALLGSSGVGKSTLVNTLTGRRAQATGDVRQSDQKGRHTTSVRSMHRLPTGGWLLDTPGMRELQLPDAPAGIEEVFEDIVELAASCRFTDCRHETEPGCAIRAALEAGRLEPERLARYRKLVAEQERAAEGLPESRRRARGVGRTYKAIQAAKRRGIGPPDGDR